MQQTIKTIEPSELIAETLGMRNAGYRLVAISSTNKDSIEITYSFDKEYDFVNLRINIGYDAEIESITGMYPFAFLYENEIKELFGVDIKNIVLDFDNKLYRINVKTPFNMKKENE